MTKEFKLILATSNKDKAREIAEILSDTPFVVTTMKEEGFDPDIVEDGKTFEENALIKARTVHALAQNAYVMAQSFSRSCYERDRINDKDFNRNNCRQRTRCRYFSRISYWRSY